MTIAELFVKIGIKGGPEATKNLKAINSGMQEIASSSLAAKAAVAGVIIGLERLTGFASQIGLDLEKFGVITGLSTRELQKWQHAAMLFDVSGNEMADTIKGVQSAMTNMKLGKGAPEGFAAMMDMVKLDENKIDDTFYVLSKIQEFIKKAPAAEGRTLAAGVGISDNMFQALKMMNLARDQGTSKDWVTPEQQKQLVEINRQWKEIWHTLKMIGVAFVAGNGLFMTKHLKDAAIVVRDLSAGFMDLMKNSEAFRTAIVAAGLAIAASFAPLSTAVAGLIYLLGEYKKFTEGQDNIFQATEAHANLEKTGGVSGIVERLKNNKMDMLQASLSDTFGAFGKVGSWMGLGGGGGGQPVNITNNVTTHGVNDAKGVGREVGKASDTAARQMAAQKRPR